MTIVRRILPVLLAAVLLSACGETKDVLPEIEQEVKQEVETVLEEVEPTPEPTQTPEEPRPWIDGPATPPRCPAGHRPFHLERRRQNHHGGAGKAVCPLRNDPAGKRGHTVLPGREPRCQRGDGLHRRRGRPLHGAIYGHGVQRAAWTPRWATMPRRWITIGGC